MMSSMGGLFTLRPIVSVEISKVRPFDHLYFNYLINY